MKILNSILATVALLLLSFSSASAQALAFEGYQRDLTNSNEIKVIPSQLGYSIGFDTVTGVLTALPPGGEVEVDQTVTNASVGGAAAVGSELGVNPFTGDFFYVDNAGNWQPVPAGAEIEVDQTVTAASIGTAAAAGSEVGIDPLTGDHFYVDGAGLWQPITGGGGISADAGQILTLGTDSLPLFVKDCGTPAVPEVPAVPAGGQEPSTINATQNILLDVSTGSGPSMSANAGAVINTIQLYDLTESNATGTSIWALPPVGAAPTTTGQAMSFSFVFQQNLAATNSLTFSNLPLLNLLAGAINIDPTNGAVYDTGNDSFNPSLTNSTTNFLGNGLIEIILEYTSDTPNQTVAMSPAYSLLPITNSTPNAATTGTVPIGNMRVGRGFTGTTPGAPIGGSPAIPAIPAVPGTLDMIGATAIADGECGFAPTPAAGEEGLFLRGDGTWAVAGAADNLGNHTATQEIIIPNVAAPAATAGQVKLYTVAGELFVIDGAGNTTQISPHHQFEFLKGDYSKIDQLRSSKTHFNGNVIQVEYEFLKTEFAVVGNTDTGVYTMYDGEENIVREGQSDELKVYAK